MLFTAKNVLFPGHNHLLTTGVDDLSLIITLAGARATKSRLGHQHRRLAGGFELEIRLFQRWIAWRILGFLFSAVKWHDGWLLLLTYPTQCST